MIMMIKRNDDLYVLLLQTEQIGQFVIVSELTKKDYDFMLTYFKRIRNCDDATVKEYGNACYYFPVSQIMPEVQVMLYNRATDDYVIKLNFKRNHYHHLAQMIVSEMIGVELDLMIFELECLPNHQTGTPAYFPPAKDKDNDKRRSSIETNESG